MYNSERLSNHSNKLTILCFIASQDHSHHTTIKYPPPVLVIQQFLRWYHVLGIILFLWASYHQYKCHKILADLRKPTEKRTESSDSPNASKKDTLLDQNQQLPSGKDNQTTAKLQKSTEKKSASSYLLKVSKEVNHKQLSNGTENTSLKYGMPNGDWFYYVSCPHLFAEILIYLSLLVCHVWSEVACSWWLVVGHVTCSLFLSARQMHGWYHHKFEDYPKSRTSLFPGIC